MFYSFLLNFVICFICLVIIINTLFKAQCSVKNLLFLCLLTSVIFALYRFNIVDDHFVYPLGMLLVYPIFKWTNLGWRESIFAITFFGVLYAVIFIFLFSNFNFLFS